MRVFLGGTCSGYDWRSQLIPLLKCDYYNPIVKNWQESDRLREVQERENDDFILYVITNGLKGVYSIAEVVDDSNKRPEKTIFCPLYKDMNNKLVHSLEATCNLLESNGIYIFKSLDEVAQFLNKKV